MAKKAEAADEVEEVEQLSTLEEAIEDLGSEAQSLSAKVRRLARPQDKTIAGVNAGFIGSLDPLNAYSVEHDLEEMGGGGRFALDLYVNGHRLKDEDGNGVTRVVVVDGVAHPKREPKPEPVAPVTQSLGVPSPLESELKATIARMEQREAERERAQEKLEERQALAQMIAAAMAPIAAKLEAVAVKPAPTLSPFEELTLARMKREDKLSTEGAEPAYVTALKGTVEAMAAQLKAQEKDRAEEKHQRELEKRDAEIAELRDEIEAVVAQANAPRAKNPLLENLTESMVTVATIDKLLNAGRSADEPKVDYFKDFMAKNGKKIVTAIGPSVEKKLDDVMAALTNTAPSATPPTPGVPSEDGSAFAVWLQEQWNAKPPLSACRDPVQIHARLKSHPKTLSALAAVRDAERLKAFLKSLGAFPAAMIDSSVTPQFWTEMAPRLDELRATLDSLVSAARAESEKKDRAEAAARVSEPRDNFTVHEGGGEDHDEDEDTEEEDEDGDEDEEDEAEGDADGDADGPA